LGLVELHLNGRLVSDELFVPVVSDYHYTENRRCFKEYGEHTSHRIYCLRYDVTDMLSEHNCIGAALSIGWYTTRTYGKIKLSLRLLVTFEDGTSFEYLSGEQLKWNYSPITRSHFLFGESHDYMAHRLDGWDLAGYGDSDWKSVEIAETPDTDYYIQDCPTDRIIRHIEPKLIKEADGVRIYDMGENITGTPIIKCNGKPGSKVTLFVSERLDADGNIEEYTGHMQEADFITDGSNREYSLRFCFFGFRYASVTDNAVITDCLVIHADVDVTSSFKSSNKQLNWMYDAYIRTQLDNMHMGIPSDCPHCEKRGYTGDGQLTCEAAMMMLDAKRFYRKWLYDIADCQDPKNGHVQNTAPYLPSGGGPGGWGSAIAEVPYMYYKTYGDTSVLEEFLPRVYKYFDYLDAHSENNIVVSDNYISFLGDWCIPDGNEVTGENGVVIPEVYDPLLSPKYVNTYFYVKSINRAIEYCKVLNKTEDIPRLERLAEAKKSAIMRDFYDPASGDFCVNQNSANVFAIDIGLGDKRTLDHVAEHFMAEPWYNTGIFGTDIATRILFTHGYANVAYKLLTSDGKYSFGKWMRDGYTTFPEYWTYLRSQNHPMFGAAV
ncbi:MAG: family 78 glycoside hydrolase catalytic domain, partial [Lachnospiraceae bacterium]|nr:family 78 glycoside hydrolase catalytic domain [Lachnospiraceae bacterium]